MNLDTKDSFISELIAQSKEIINKCVT